MELACNFIITIVVFSGIQVQTETYPSQDQVVETTKNNTTFIIRIEKDLNQLVQNFTFDGYMPKEIDSSAIVQIFQKKNLSRHVSAQEFLDKIKTELNKVNQLNLDSIKNVKNNIDDALVSLGLSLLVTPKVNPQANLTQQKALLEKLKNDAKLKTNTSISEIIRQSNDIIQNFSRQYLGLNNDYKNKITELNETLINNRCKEDNEVTFIVCVDNIIKEYNNDINNVLRKIFKLYDVVKNITDTLDTNITSKVRDDLIQFDNISDTVSAQIYNNFNVTDQQVIYNALGDDKQYSLYTIKQTVAKLTSVAAVINNREKNEKFNANHKLTVSGAAIIDMVSIGSNLCGATSVDPYIKEYTDIISTAKRDAFAVAPDLSNISNSLLQLANNINNTLNYQTYLLSEEKLYESCPKTLADNDKLLNHFKCIFIQINKFGRYYSSEFSFQKLVAYNYDVYAKEQQSQRLLNQWISTTIVPKYNEISKKAKKSAEEYYNKCNISVQDVVEYTANISRNHYNNFQSEISTNVTAINELLPVLSSRNYSFYKPDIYSQLQDVVAPLKTAIMAVLDSKKRSIITEAIRHAPADFIEDGVKVMNNFTASLTASALDAKQAVPRLIASREAIYKKYTNDFMMSCYDKFSSFPIVDMSACSNSQVYRIIYEYANLDILNRLLDIKQNLININNNFMKLFSEQADYLVKTQQNSAYSLTYKLYKAAGLQIPQDVEIYRCFYGITLPNNQFICVFVN